MEQSIWALQHFEMLCNWIDAWACYDAHYSPGVSQQPDSYAAPLPCRAPALDRLQNSNVLDFMVSLRTMLLKIKQLSHLQRYIIALLVVLLLSASSCSQHIIISPLKCSRVSPDVRLSSPALSWAQGPKRKSTGSLGSWPNIGKKGESPINWCGVAL